MDDDRHYLIAKEGWYHILFVAVLAVLATFTIGWLSTAIWCLLLFLIQFFRDPDRVITENDGGVLSPADGRVVCVEKSKYPQNDEKALKISVFMNIFNVHSNRSPVAGEIIKKTYIQGKFFNAAFDKASENNERNSLIIKAKNGHLVCCVQIAGLIARRILCYAKEGDYLQQGQRYGFIRFGSRLDLYLPLTAVPKVAIGDKVTAGKTLVAFLDG